MSARATRILLVGSVLALAAGPSPAGAQVSRRLLPSKRFMPILVGAPREPTTAVKLIFVTRSATRFDEVREAEVALGTTLPLLILSGTTPEHSLVLGVQGGIFSRFSMETEERDLLSTDWIFAVPVVLRRGRHWIRARYFHQSSHLGDEYIERFNVERIPYGRDEIELLGFLGASDAWGWYAGGRYGFRVEPIGTGRWTARFGTQVNGPELGAGFQLYGATDVEMTDAEDWDPRINLHAGVRISTFEDRWMRLAAELLTGPSPQGQFLGERATFVTLGLYFDL